MGKKLPTELTIRINYFMFSKGENEYATKEVLK